MSGNDDRLGADNAEATKKPDPKAEMNDTPTGVYCWGAPLYREAGWRSALPLPPAQKSPPPKGFTGHDGVWPTDEQIAEWITDKPSEANLMLRVNYGVMGIDVDAYDTKTGARTLTEAENRWGALPDTYRSSARINDSDSGIRLFRVPAGVLFRGVIKFAELGIGDIEIVQPHHRFVVAWPSINPKNSQRYRWYALDGSLMPEGLVPRVADLPELPTTWVEALSRDALCEAVFDGTAPNATSARRQQINDEMYQRLIASEGDGEPDHAVARRLERALSDLTGGTGSRYDTTRDHVLALTGMKSTGHIGVPDALNRLYRAYIDVVSDSRPQAVAESEFLRFTEGAAALVASAPQVDEVEEAFWAQRQILTDIRDFSRSRGVAPFAVLGGVLRRAIAMVPPSVQLPPTVGDAASINLFTVSVGRSGQGKDAANGVARAAVVFVNGDDVVIEDPPSAVGLGSGEGLAKALRATDDDDAVPARVNLEVPEIGTLGALANRTGATVIGELLKAYMGQPLGFTNARRDTTSFVPAHSYRLCLSVGAQPENADVFMSREKDGLPQRFLWLPTIDPHAPPPSDVAGDQVRAARVVLPASFPSVIPGTPHFVRIPTSVKKEIRWHRHRVVKGDAHVDPLDGHLMLTRLKVGFGLALLDGRNGVNEDDWLVAGQLIEVSNRQRASLRKSVVERRKQANVARANDQADRQEVMDDRQTERIQRRVRKAVLGKLKRDGLSNRSSLRRACDSTIRSDFEVAFEKLLDGGEVVCRQGGVARADEYGLPGD